MSERSLSIFRALSIAGLACLLMGARAQQLPSPSAAQNAALTPNMPGDAAASASGSRGVIAVVNDTVISDYDLNQRMALFVATSGARPNEATMKRFREEVLRALVDEVLQLQEAQKNKISVTTEEIDKAMLAIAQQNNVSLAQIEQMLKGSGVDIATLRSQIAAQIAWQKLMQHEMAARIIVSDEDVNTALARFAQGARAPQYHVSEIFIGVDSPAREDQARESALQIAQQLNMGAPFANVARQFSQSPSAAVGGDIGWIQQGQLADELDKAIATLKTGGIAGPIRVAGGYYILQLRERREPMGTAVAKPQQQQAGVTSGPVPLARLLLPMPAKPSEELKGKAMQFAEGLRERINGCANLNKLASQINGAVYMNLGTMKPADLSPDLRKALENTQSGDVAQPFFSQAGLEIIVRCDPKAEKVVAFEMPTRKQVESRLFQDQMSMMARRYLRDLRRDAVVEYR